VRFQYPEIGALGARDVYFVLVWLLTLGLLVPVQLASMIAFDSTGLDTLVPGFVFMTVVPAVALGAVLTLAGRRLYTPRATRPLAAGSFVVFAALSSYTAQFYGLCGPGC